MMNYIFDVGLRPTPRQGLAVPGPGVSEKHCGAMFFGKGGAGDSIPCRGPGRSPGIKQRLSTALAALLLALCLATAAQAAPLKVIAGTSLIDDIVHDLTGGDVQTVTLIKGSSCPGHESVKTTDFVFAARADLLLIHAFQENMVQVTGIIEAVRNETLRVAVLKPKGSWLIPSVQKTAISDVADALAAAVPEREEAIRQRAARRMARVDEAAAESAALLAPIAGKRVVAATVQSEFVRWAGADVAKTYDRAEDMTPSAVAGLVKALRGEGIAGVIDNSQSGSDAGLPLALELKVPHLVLSNFPGSSDDATDYFSLLRHNIAQLLRLAG